MARCSRTWKIEAARDGRLDDRARADVELHAERCEDCRAEARLVEELGARLRAIPVSLPDDLGARRLRGRTLEAADAALAGRGPSRSAASRRLVPWALLATAVLALVVWRARGTAETRVIASDEGGARWSIHQDDATEHVDLLDGSLAIRVRRPSGGRRVVVRVPDGEIEDIGTVFHVTVAEGRTSRVHVDEGRVLVRIGATAPRLLLAGQTWERKEETTAAAPSAAEPAPVVAAPSARATPATSASVRHPTPSALPSTVAAATPRTSPATSSSSPTSALGDVEEDHSYVQVVRLLREGRDAEAKAAARDYLRRFPHGFRREEMDWLVRAEH